MGWSFCTQHGRYIHRLVDTYTHVEHVLLNRAASSAACSRTLTYFLSGYACFQVCQSLCWVDCNRHSAAILTLDDDRCTWTRPGKEAALQQIGYLQCTSTHARTHRWVPACKGSSTLQGSKTWKASCERFGLPRQPACPPPRALAQADWVSTSS